jgi:hypothetical protein
MLASALHRLVELPLVELPHRWVGIVKKAPLPPLSPTEWHPLLAGFFVPSSLRSDVISVARHHLLNMGPAIKVKPLKSLIREDI